MAAAVLVCHSCSGMLQRTCSAAMQRCGAHAGGFDCEEDAARAHDVMAMKCRGLSSITNYSHSDYEDLLPKLDKLSKVLASLKTHHPVQDLETIEKTERRIYRCEAPCA